MKIKSKCQARGKRSWTNLSYAPRAWHFCGLKNQPIIVSENGRPLTVLHSQTFCYDGNIPHMIGIYTLLRYEGGKVVPRDDMIGSDFRWWGLDELETAVAAGTITLHVSTHLWMLRRAVKMVRCFVDDWPETAVLQPKL